MGNYFKKRCITFLFRVSLIAALCFNGMHGLAKGQLQCEWVYVLFTVVCDTWNKLYACLFTSHSHYSHNYNTTAGHRNVKKCCCIFSSESQSTSKRRSATVAHNINGEKQNRYHGSLQVPKSKLLPYKIHYFKYPKMY